MGIIKIDCDVSQVSDGYHTFGELYEHRCILFVALMLSNPSLAWKSRQHHDGSTYDDYFIAGMHLPSGQITYHLPNYYWANHGMGAIQSLDKAPEWDGHTSWDVLQRMEDWCDSIGAGANT